MSKTTEEMISDALDKIWDLVLDCDEPQAESKVKEILTTLITQVLEQKAVEVEGEKKPLNKNGCEVCCECIQCEDWIDPEECARDKALQHAADIIRGTNT